MSDIKRGDILAVKTTGEIVYVLKAYPEDRAENASGILIARDPQAGTVTVRRPLLTEYGIKHEVTDFDNDELEPVEAYAEREANIQILKLKMQRKLMDEKVKSMRESQQAEDIDFTVN